MAVGEAIKNRWNTSRRNFDEASEHDDSSDYFHKTVKIFQ